MRIGFRGSTVAFGLMTGIVTLGAMGIFVLMDPRAQAFWASRLGEAMSLVRSLFVR
jgi:hypothetical protein